MDAIAKLFFFFSLLLLSGCYTLKSAYNQVSILVNRESYESILSRNDLKEAQRRKLLLAQEVRDFAIQELGLHSNGNYMKVTWLNRPYVVWAVAASDPWAVKAHQWSFPIVGKVPYLGFFNQKEAEEKERELIQEGFDTYVRGVSAYSTLGWFADPLLSSMLNYQDETLAETIIHELVHTTIWIPDNVNFNERLASYLGQKGAEIFYLKKEGSNSPSFKRMQDETHDDKVFSSFITAEVKHLDEWYAQLKPEEKTIENKEKRIRQIQEKFSKEVKQKMRSSDWHNFEKLKLNNARLMMYRTYMSDFSAFDKLWDQLGGDFKLFLEKCKLLKKSKKPDVDLELLHESSHTFKN